MLILATAFQLRTHCEDKSEEKMLVCGRGARGRVRAEPPATSCFLNMLFINKGSNRILLRDVVFDYLFFLEPSLLSRSKAIENDIEVCNYSMHVWKNDFLKKERVIIKASNEIMGHWQNI